MKLIRFIETIPVLALFFLCGTAFAGQEVVSDFSENSLPVLNEELRKMQKEITSTNLWEDSSGVIQLKTSSDINFQGNQAKSMVIENRTSDPSAPETGQIWYRTDL